MITLQTILDATRAESEERQRKYPLAMVQRKVQKMAPTRGFARALRQQPFSVIAELKRKSPSMGKMIREKDIQTALQIYHEHPLVSAISVLTQSCHFGGSTDDLEKVRQMTQCRPKPVLRKDFIFSPYEVYFSRWLGADAILLMANVVEREKFRELHDLAHSLGLDVLCEVHEQGEIDHLPQSAGICGINSRRFKGAGQKKTMARKLQELVGLAPAHDTSTDLNAFQLFSNLPAGVIRVAESGVSSANIGGVLEKYPFDAALIGTSLLQSGREQMRKHLDRIRELALAVRAKPTPASAQAVFAQG
jgi:indole-3-glycerol phosphate synthase